MASGATGALTSGLVSRTAWFGSPIGPGSLRSRSRQAGSANARTSPNRFLRAITIDAAFQHFEEDLKGSLEPGKLADLVVLERSPLAVSAEEIAGIPVLETIVGGESVWRADPR